MEVRGAWSSYLELVVEPPGWLAVLLPSLDTARALGGQEGRRGAVTVQVSRGQEGRRGAVTVQVI